MRQQICERRPYLLRPGGTVSTSGGGARFTLGRETREQLDAAARRKGTTFGRLVGDLLDRIVEDDLIDAVLDE